MNAQTYFTGIRELATAFVVGVVMLTIFLFTFYTILFCIFMQFVILFYFCNPKDKSNHVPGICTKLIHLHWRTCYSLFSVVVMVMFLFIFYSILIYIFTVFIFYFYNPKDEHNRVPNGCMNTRTHSLALENLLQHVLVGVVKFIFYAILITFLLYFLIYF